MTDQADRAMANLAARLCGQPEPFPRRPAPAPLRAVTADNAHEFSPAPRNRGRPRKIDARDNVVLFQPPRWIPRHERVLRELLDIVCEVPKPITPQMRAKFVAPWGTTQGKPK